MFHVNHLHGPPWQSFQPSLFWNYLDLTIVCTSFIEVIFDILLLVQADDGSDTRIAPTNLLRVIRIVRVLRVMRVIKVLLGNRGGSWW